MNALTRALMPLTNRDFARYAAQVARRASSWTHDTMTAGRERWDNPATSAERFCQDIEEVLGWIRAEAEQTR